MIIKEILIEKFRGFQGTHFQLGKFLTVIAGQNGTQKTTLLGMLSQPFSITLSDNPMHGEKPLCGGNFRSGFAEKFKLSDTFDKAKHHEWTLKLNDNDKADFTVESIPRKDKGKKETIRFWKKGDRTKGAGYIQLPVIYLSLSRLLPIGEDDNIDLSDDVVLSSSEFSFYKKWHNRILIIPDVLMTGVDYLASKQKNTLGVNTAFYDWKMNSAGQDNLGKILLAILSFKRLKEKHPNTYKGGILAIDELDATLYPASQIKLIEALRKFASTYKIQIIITTHSLSILRLACELQSEINCLGQTKVVYLEKFDRQVDAIEGLSFEKIQHKLNVTLNPSLRDAKIPVFTEDKEGEIFLKAILKRKASCLQCLGCSLSATNLIELSRNKIPGLKFPDSLIVLDGDVRTESSVMRKINKLSNILLLPGNESPERLLANFLYELSDRSPIWNEIKSGYTKQICFSNISVEDVQSDRKKAKDWFQTQSMNWGRGCAKVINPWMLANMDEVENFKESFQAIHKEFRKVLSL